MWRFTQGLSMSDVIGQNDFPKRNSYPKSGLLQPKNQCYPPSPRPGHRRRSGELSPRALSSYLLPDHCGCLPSLSRPRPFVYYASAPVRLILIVPSTVFPIYLGTITQGALFRP